MVRQKIWFEVVQAKKACKCHCCNQAVKAGSRVMKFHTVSQPKGWTYIPEHWEMAEECINSDSQASDTVSITVDPHTVTVWVDSLIEANFYKDAFKMVCKPFFGGKRFRLTTDGEQFNRRSTSKVVTDACSMGHKVVANGQVVTSLEEFHSVTDR